MTYTFGLDTFGDRNGDADGKPLSHAETIRNVAEEGVLAEQAGVDFFGIGEHHTEALPDAGRGRGARRDRGPHVPDPPGVGGHRAELGRPGPGVPAVLHAERPVRRPGRGHHRPRVEHRLVPAVRLRPRRLRAALRREGHAVRRAAQGRAGHLGGQDPRAAAEPGRGAAHRVRPVPRLDRRRRQPGVGGPRRPPRLRPGAGHHRRPARPVRRVRRALRAGPGEVRPPAAPGHGALPRSRRGHRRAGEGRSSGRAGATS